MAEQGHITLTELQRAIRDTLGERFALPVWVSAEVSELKLNYSGHCYMELVEKGGDNGVPLSQARAVIWRSAYPKIAGYFEAETGERLAAGIKVLVRLIVTYHELYGLSLQIIDIDPSYTLGDMARQRQATINLLQQEGVWDMNREQALPQVVQRIAVISSANAAGYQDFMSELTKSPYRFVTTLFDAFMQGAAAEESIIEALCAIAERADDFDAAVIIRGGGSATDLKCFDAYRLASHVAQFPLPILTGIGHDKDTSVVDMVAHTQLKTPTAVATWLVERMQSVDAWLGGAALELHDRATETTHRHSLHLERLMGNLRSSTAQLLTHTRFTLSATDSSLPRSVEEYITRQQARLTSLTEITESHSPARVLRLGYSVVRLNGHALKSAAEVSTGDSLRITLSDGEIRAKAE